MLIKLRKVEATYFIICLSHLVMKSSQKTEEKQLVIVPLEKKYSDKILSTKYIKMQNSLVINKSHCISRVYIFPLCSDLISDFYFQFLSR